jgi:hypothetical protein
MPGEVFLQRPLHPQAHPTGEFIAQRERLRFSGGGVTPHHLVELAAKRVPLVVPALPDRRSRLNDFLQPRRLLRRQQLLGAALQPENVTAEKCLRIGPRENRRGNRVGGCRWCRNRSKPWMNQCGHPGLQWWRMSGAERGGQSQQGEEDVEPGLHAV